jgi:glycosyltransferase involved in cell wall biosynthesis
MQRKIKVLRIIARLNIGGPAIHTILLTEGLNKDKFDSLLVSGIVGDGEEDMSYLAEEKGIKPIIIPELGRKISFKNDLIAFWKLYKLIRRESPDIIHTHTAKAGTLGRLAGILYNLVTGYWLLVTGKQRCKLIHTFHGHVLHSYFGKIMTWLFIWIERILARFTDRIIVVNERIKKDLLGLGIGNPKKIAVIPLGLDLEKLLMISTNTNPTPRVGIVGRLVSVKNHRMFLDAIRLFLTQHPTSNTQYQFFIVGDGELRDELENYAERLGIRDSVIFTGWQRDLERLYSDLDIITLTSLNEGTPVSLIEAMAAGKVVIATDVGGVKDLLDTTRGILVKSEDVEGFAQGLSLLLNNEDLRKRIGQSGREFVKNRFTKERLIRDIENLYELLAETESRPRFGLEQN